MKMWMMWSLLAIQLTIGILYIFGLVSDFLWMTCTGVILFIMVANYFVLNHKYIKLLEKALSEYDKLFIEIADMQWETYNAKKPEDTKPN